MKKLDKTNKKIPFNGSSQNLIDAFYIIGYDDNFIEKYIKESDRTYQPTILSAVTSSNSKNNINLSMMLKIIYPKNPSKLINTSKPTSNSIFSFSFDSIDGKNKNACLGYTFYFYEKYSWNYYIPKCFVIISQFPFFTTFKKICEEIYDKFNNRLTQDIPIEIIIYNYVNFIPSPIDFDLYLFVFSGDKIVKLRQLSGYPIIDLNLSELFSLLSPTLVVEIFLFSIFEPDMLFFSENLEILNVVMYIFSMLNYPCADSIFFWYIFSISKEEFANPSFSKIICDRFCSSLYGVNCTYDENVKTTVKLSNYFIIDLDHQKVIYKTRYTSPKLIEGTKNGPTGYSYYVLEKFINKVFKEKNGIKGARFLDKFIKRLITDLERIISDYEKKKPEKNKKIDFFTMSNTIYKTNKLIQESFYDFYLNTLTMFYQDNRLTSYLDKFQPEKANSLKKNKTQPLKRERDKGNPSNPFFLEYNKNYEDFSEDEKKFCDLFRTSSKYEIYFNCFILDFRCLDIYRIPLTFSEEFISMKKNQINIYSNLFELMDSFYNSYFGDTLQKKKKYKISFKVFEFLIRNELSNFKPKKATKGIILNSEILKKYIFYINNKSEKELFDLFPPFKIMRENIIQEISPNQIIDSIEKQIFSKGIISPNQILSSSILIISLITRRIEAFNEKNAMLFNNTLNVSTNLLNYLLNKKSPFIRKYIFLNLLLLYKTTVKLEESGKDISNYSKLLQSFYYIMINFMRTNSILPNSQIVELLSSLDQQIKKFKEAKVKKVESVEDTIESEKKEGSCDFSINLKFNFCSCGSQQNIDVFGIIMRETEERNVISECDCPLKTVIRPLISVNIGGKEIESYVFSPCKLKHSCERLLYQYLDVLSFEDVDKVQLKEVMANLIFYTKSLFTSEFDKVSSFIIQELNLLIKEDFN